MNDFILRDIRIGEYTVDIKFSVKGLSIVRGHVKAESMDVGFSLSEDETLNSNECVLELLDNPAVKRLVEKFTDEVDFKPSHAKDGHLENKLNDLREQITSHKKATDKAIESLRRNQEHLMDRLNRFNS